MEETENPRCQEGDICDDYIEPYLTTYHVETCDVEVTGESTSTTSQPEPPCHDVSLSKDESSTKVNDDDVYISKDQSKTTETRDGDKDDTYISDHEYNYIDNTSGVDKQDTTEEQRSGIATSHDIHPSQTDPTQRDYTYTDDHDYTYTDDHDYNYTADHDYTYTDDHDYTYTDDHDYNYTADHDYTYTDDHDYTYIDNTSTVDTQAAGEKGGLASRGQCPSQATEPVKNASLQQGKRGEQFFLY
ncbi:uncharacterized protein LOC144885463 [Branchiostoma floridae x Branchiostoma japonicum]